MTLSSPFVPGDVYRTLPRAPETWIVADLIPMGGLCNLYGAPKGGKSFAALQLAAAVSQNEPEWLSFQIHTHGPVCYLQIDTPRSLWGDRLDKLAAEGLDFSNIYFADAEQAPYPFDILTEGYQWLKAQVAEIKPILVIIDTIRELHGGDENDSAQMKNVVAALVAATRPAACLLLSHSRKDNIQVPEELREDLLNDNRGSGYVAGRMDGIVRASSSRKGSRLTYQSRTVDRGIIKCQRLHNGLWTLDRSDEEALIKVVLADTTLTTLGERAAVLSEKTGRSPEACRSLLRRRAERQHTKSVHTPHASAPISAARALLDSLVPPTVLPAVRDQDQSPAPSAPAPAL